MAIETTCVHLLLLLLASFHVRISWAQSEDSCTVSDGRCGSCIPLPDCKYATDLISPNGITSPTVQQFIRPNSCGFVGNIPKVCCPQDQSSTGGTHPVLPNEGVNTRTGGNSQGNGDWLFPDQGGNTGGNNPGNGGQSEGSNNPASGGQGQGSDIPASGIQSQGSDNPGSEGQETNPNVGSVLPDSCGVINSNRIIGGEATDLGEFPWMAVIEYLEYRQTLRTGCGGALISKRYVLTAAHCIRSIPPTWQVRSVRLGEHNTATDPDCATEDGQQRCADPAISVRYESIIVHEGYNRPERFRNDIALIRLARDVQFTASVQPICLPPTGDADRRYFAAGWGLTESGRNSEVKLKVRLDFADFRQCAQRYTANSVIMGDGQMCAGGTAGKDTCKGDSGGPLMKLARLGDRDRWVVDGLVSIGHKPCGLDGWPAVYTKVFDYVPWIMSNLRP